MASSAALSGPHKSLLTTCPAGLQSPLCSSQARYPPLPPPFSTAPNRLPDTLTTVWEGVSTRFALVNGPGEGAYTVFSGSSGTYGSYLDEVWTLDDRRFSITVAQLQRE